ncbi:toxin-antitoxin system HicB family antitoxin [Nakamurella deserti]|uniref:toxin-antitoxin system HicB family antitoxin n=1 Tax=Nakamurella deserti TaxID=2164074 RepID=UPI000DBE1097|nr:toxin-antitoxin system HicB family antitoxin [Nakamurella deserti]
MDLSTYTSELRDNLTAAASLGDEATRRAASAVAAALEPSARLALMHALSDLAAEVTRQLSAGGTPVTVDVRIEGRDVRVVADRAPGGTATPAATPDTARDDGGDADGTDRGHERTFAEAGGDLTRTTVRMFNELKGRAEKAAAEQGVSLNSFISRAVAESIKTDLPRKWKDKAERHDRDTPRGETISGYVQG